MATEKKHLINELDIALSILYAFHREDVGKGITIDEIFANFRKRNLIVDENVFTSVFDKMRMSGMFTEFGETTMGPKRKKTTVITRSLILRNGRMG